MYVGAPEKVFVGDAVVEQGVHHFTSVELERFPSHLGFEFGLSLVDARTWPLSVSLNDVWHKTSRGNARPMFREGICAFPEADAELIIARGRRETPPGTR